MRHADINGIAKGRGPLPAGGTKPSGFPCCRQDIVQREIVGQVEAFDWVPCDAFGLACLEAEVFEHEGEFGGGDEVLPVVGAAGD